MKILVAEDIDSIGLGLETLFRRLGEVDVTQVAYCREAYLKLQRASIDGVPFDILVTDLMFDPGNSDSELKGGEDLIALIREKKINVRIVVYSVENRLSALRRLFEKYAIDGYVTKGRDSNRELLAAIETVMGGKRHLPSQFPNLLTRTPLTDVTEYDLTLLRMLSEGLKNEEISARLKAKGESAASLSSVEKKIARLKLIFDARNSNQLVLKVKELGLI